MKRGSTAIVLILVLVVAAIGAFSLFNIINPSGAAQTQPVVMPGGQVSQWTTGPQCCRIGMAYYSPAAHVNSGAKCRAAYFDGYQAVIEQCPMELNKPLDLSSCKEANRIYSGNGCQVDVCCNAMS